MVAKLCSVALVLLLATATLFPNASVRAQADPAVRDRVIPTAVQIAAQITLRENASPVRYPLPLGSGTIVSPTGLILTNQHVVDFDALRVELQALLEQYAQERPNVQVELDDDEVTVLVSDGKQPPRPSYTARVERADYRLDLAVLRIIGDEEGSPLESGARSIPFVPLGDSERLGLGDQIQVFGYPAIGGDALSYTTGVVSGFPPEEGMDGMAWITTDAVISGGSSGGTAVNSAGELIGVPTQGASLDCRPGDTNRDGVLNAEDVGCVPVGGSLGQLRPVHLAKPLLLAVDPEFDMVASNGLPKVAQPEGEPTATPVSAVLPTPRVIAVATLSPTPLPPPPTPTPTATPVTPTPVPTPSPSPTPTAIAPTPTPTRVPRTPEPAAQPNPPMQASEFIPAVLPLTHAGCFGISTEGVYPFSEVVAWLEQAGAAPAEIQSWGWRDGAYRSYECRTPPLGGASRMDVVHLFRDPASTRAAVPYFIAGYSLKSTEARLCDSTGPLLVCVTASSPSISPISDVRAVLDALLGCV